MGNRITIHKTLFGGTGLGHDHGKTFLIEDSVEGDEVFFEIFKEKPRLVLGRRTGLAETNLLRQPAPCLCAETCGGCDWQGISYLKQLHWKRQFLKDAFRQIPLRTPFPYVVPSPQAFQYRNRVLLRGRWVRGKPLELGFFARHSHKIVSLSATESCLLAEPSIANFLRKLSQFPLMQGPPQELAFRLEIQVLHQASECLLITLWEARQEDKSTLGFLKEFLGAQPEVKWCGLREEASRAPVEVVEEHQGLSHYTQPGLFFQVNLGANHRLRQRVLWWAQELGAKSAVDLFCGSGNFSLVLAHCLGLPVQGLEGSQASVAVAQYAATAQKLGESCTFQSVDLLQNPIHLRRILSRVDLLLVDPPRAGLWPLLGEVLALRPSTILYVSCDVATCSRDVKALTERGYVLRALEAFDFFPQTYHLETLAVLEQIS